MGGWHSPENRAEWSERILELVMARGPLAISEILWAADSEHGIQETLARTLLRGLVARGRVRTRVGTIRVKRRFGGKVYKVPATLYFVPRSAQQKAPSTRPWARGPPIGW